MRRHPGLLRRVDRYGIVVDSVRLASARLTPSPPRAHTGQYNAHNDRHTPCVHFQPSLTRTSQSHGTGAAVHITVPVQL